MEQRMIKFTEGNWRASNVLGLEIRQYRQGGTSEDLRKSWSLSTLKRKSYTEILRINQ